MPNGTDIASRIKRLTPYDLRMFKQQLRQRITDLGPQDRESVFARIRGIPELSDIVGGFELPAPPQPAYQQPPMEYEAPTDIPLWQNLAQKGFQLGMTGLGYLSEYALEPFHEHFAKPLAMGATSPFWDPTWWQRKPFPEAVKESWAMTKGLFDPESKQRQLYEAWQAPQWETGRYWPEVTIPEWLAGEEIPFGGEEITLGAKGAAELAPWFAIPSAGGVAAKLRTAGKVGEIAAKGLAPAVAAERAITYPIAKPIEMIGKRMAPKAVGTRVPTIAELIDANTDPRIAAKIAERLGEAPGVADSLMRDLSAATLEEAIGKKAAVAWMGLRDVAPSIARIEMDAVYATDSPFIIDIATGLVRNVKPKSPQYKPFIQAIAEFPERYNLNRAQKAEVDLLDTILKRQLARELEIGVGVRPIGLKEGQRYFPRFVEEITDLETKATREVRRGMARRPGMRPGSFRERYYEEVLDGIVKGKKYSVDYRAAVETRLSAGNQAIADKRLEDFLKPLGKLPRERIPSAIRAEAWGATRQYAGIRQFQKVVNRALRGEKLPEATLMAQERRFPTLGARLRKAIGDQKALKGLIKKAKALEPELQAGYWTAKRVATRALAQARMPIVGKEGAINHAGLQGRLFPIEVADSANAIIRGEITPHRVLQEIAKINAIARMGQTAIDTGFVFIQGLVTLANHPARWGRAFVQCLQTLVNPKYTARWNAVPKISRIRGIIATHGGAPFGGTEFTEAARAGGWLVKLPVAGKIFKRFGRVFEDYIDTARTLLVETKIPHYTRTLGRELTDRELTDLVVTVDHMVGIGSMRRLGISSFKRNLASNLLYAPRYYLAFVGFLGRAFQGGIGADIARNALARFSVAVPASMTALAYLLGQEDRCIPTPDKPVPKMYDPRTGEFMTVEIAGTHMGLGGVWIAGWRLLGSLSRATLDDPKDFLSIDPHENPILRYAYGRGSPVASAAIDIATGHNYLGERLDTPMDYLDEVVNKTFPFWASDQLMDTLRDEGVPKAGWQKGVAEWWGLRSWMVQYRELAREHAEEHIKDIPQEMIMPWQREKLDRGALTYEDLNNEQRAWLLLNFEDYREAEEKRRARKLETGTDFEVAHIKSSEMLDTAYHFDLENAAKAVLSHQVSLADYRALSSDLRRIRAGEYQKMEAMRQFLDEERWEDIERWLEKNAKPEDKAYDEYMELRANPPKVHGMPDWDAWAYNLNTYMKSLDPATKAYIERKRDDWINNLPPNAQKIERLIDEVERLLEPYWKIEDIVWSQYPAGLKELSDQIRMLEEMNPRRAKQLLMQAPEILYARKQIAVVQARVKKEYPQIREFLNLLY